MQTVNIHDFNLIINTNIESMFSYRRKTNAHSAHHYIIIIISWYNIASVVAKVGLVIN